ncbi:MULTISPECIES: tRNA (guanosine(37)-N1)-methyltransferase TrmD [Pedobacter]|jgi:tRNA (guanine37-N1)-methyltransferase|uniref:tRNA (guanine-N(1)-)-methyltransferase n=2 Tax=Pedobacter TaxID=84567 RepID=A0A0T5VUR1_9SPHI|nr:MULTISPECIES: tRNA (guanosine(37)-N1)-methyltransferase TrmD [Pedobacter]RYD69418.1 MAG: tRNA (guanosine(37)-N1)-methyltransferase TrmD [Sphingobacteriales bacterium]KQN34399.1 tRNA (guanine-N1)-methyltransferase [Pedobacter sp. Leaf41]KRT17574.1 tRNA (guanine-N1)-methyltransferase [Pedobacter ginsenosidimutans]MCX2472869.1 tRNA (guanosine(37)-N1)-methyltransferase TrmD [Pedobacter sp. MC2016-05]MDQ0636796.1 tRNA (guanine37-N1)-methyltransferase [Pedobacter sp. W3I1]
MRFDIITVLPALLESPFAHSILQRAQKKGIAEIVVHNLRDYATNKQKSVDDYQYGGGSGMVMSIEPFAACIEKLQAEREYDEIIFMSPDGVTLNQSTANELSIKKNIIILCGHYKGIDQRIRDIFVTREISVGDYVLSGGELPAAIVVDAVVRLIPGVLNDETSALSDSFQGELLDAPVYTRPADWRGHKVPDVLLSGHEAKVNEWRHEQALERTKTRRPDLLE